MSGFPPPPNARGRGGFALADLLCVIVIAGVVLALMVPALNRSSEAARRVGCLNNLRQLALATTNYEGWYGAFPSGPGAVPGGGAPLSWHAVLLPYLDQQAAAEGLDFSQPLSAPMNVKLGGFLIASLRCPSDPTTGGGYAGVRHHENTPPAATDTGLLRLFAPVAAATCTDGLSNTLLCGEKRDVGTLGGWAAAGPGSLRTGHVPPGADPANGFAGHHAGGANFALGDGACRWVPDATDAGVFARLCHMADGELPAEWGPVR